MGKSFTLYFLPHGWPFDTLSNYDLLIPNLEVLSCEFFFPLSSDNIIRGGGGGSTQIPWGVAVSNAVGHMTELTHI
jgi:hypothetical protein